MIPPMPNFQTVHIVPLGDTKPHITHESCKCAPAIQICQHGRVIVHNSYDGREFWQSEAAGGH